VPQGYTFERKTKLDGIGFEVSVPKMGYEFWFGPIADDTRLYQNVDTGHRRTSMKLIANILSSRIKLK
jgi:hypothetical protein